MVKMLGRTSLVQKGEGGLEGQAPPLSVRKKNPYKIHARLDREKWYSQKGHTNLNSKNDHSGSVHPPTCQPPPQKDNRLRPCLTLSYRAIFIADILHADQFWAKSVYLPVYVYIYLSNYPSI